MIGNDDSGDKESYWLIDGDSDAVMLLLMVIVLLMVMLMVVMAMTMMKMRIRITILRWRGGWGCGRMMIDEHSRKMKKAILATVAPFASTCHMRQIHIDPVIQIGKTIGPIAKNPPCFFRYKKMDQFLRSSVFSWQNCSYFSLLNTPFNVPICFMLPAAPAKALRSLSP